MANNNLGEIRRSAVITNSAPGAIADFRVGNASVSAVICGLDNWEDGKMRDISRSQTIHEERLQKKLHVKSFRLPPVVPDSDKYKDVSAALAARRFPWWLQCPICGRLAPTPQWEATEGSGARFCKHCSKGNKRTCVIPVRFVLACENGHLDDFPWHAWLGHKNDCKYKRNEERSYLKLTAKGAGLRGMEVECEKCGKSKSLEGIFSNEYWKHHPVKCRGKRPWLGDEEKCDCIPRTVQRGASNVYYPFVVSALSIPPWADDLTEKLGDYWIKLESFSDDKELLRANINHFAKQEDFATLLQSLGLDANELVERIIKKQVALENTDCDNLRPAEYKQFIAPSSNLDNFETRVEVVPQTLTKHISHIVRVPRLREVRALKGFTRIYPASGENDPRMASLSVNHKSWLPALEVRGEGIFLALNMASLREWENRTEVRARMEHLKNVPNLPKCANGEPDIGPTPRFILAHTLAHALLRQLTLECGYSTASLRERLYVDKDMAGLLIYTSTTDTDGTLGGLQRQGKTNLLENTLIKAIEALKWCSSDPLCIGGFMSSRELGSIGACHSCVIAPETSCEEFNNYLDRGLLLGWPDHPEAGYFSDLLKIV